MERRYHVPRLCFCGVVEVTMPSLCLCGRRGCHHAQFVLVWPSWVSPCPVGASLAFLDVTIPSLCLCGRPRYYHAQFVLVRPF
jgi:hypothetical protein